MDEPREMTGLLASLTDEQRARVLAYKGPENIFDLDGYVEASLKAERERLAEMVEVKFCDRLSHASEVAAAIRKGEA